MKKAFSLAEILLTLMIVAVVALMSTSVVKNKQKKIEDKPSQGLYACTMYYGKSYVFESANKDAKIPSIQSNKSSWSQKACLNGFTPPKEGVVEVTVIGGGGAGGGAAISSSESSDMQQRTFDRSGGFVVEDTGYYDFEIYGSKGTASTLMVFTNDTPPKHCPMANAYPGNPRKLSGTIALKKGDTIKVQFSGGQKLGDLPNDSCRSGLKVISHEPGQDGQDITILRNNVTIAVATGSGGGYYKCYNSNGCANRYKAESTSELLGGGHFGYNVGFTNTSQSVIYNDEEGKVVVSWSDKNDTNPIETVAAGCGGRAGSINSTIYPILSKKLPDIVIGAGGANSGDGEPTKFGALVAEGGKGDLICNPLNGNSNNGSAGAGFSASNMNYNGGSAGTISSVNGGTALGFGAGGGGGAVSGSSKGKGGSGAPGLLVLRW